ncbi:MAG: hypothetical protein ACOYL6_12025 [Bacteriovoracaceae bacterium]
MLILFLLISTLNVNSAECINSFTEGKIKNCSSLKNILEAAIHVKKKEDCADNYGEKCKKVVQDSFKQTLPTPTEHLKEMNKVSRDLVMTSVQSLFEMVNEVGDRLDTNIKDLKSCSISQINSFEPKCLANLKNLDLDSSTIAENYKTFLKERDEKSCMHYTDFKYYQVLNNEKDVAKKIQDLISTDEGKSFYGQLVKLPEDKFAEGFDSLIAAGSGKMKLLKNKINENSKLRSIFTNKQNSLAYLKDFSMTKDMQSKWVSEIEAKCSRIFKEIEKFACQLPKNDDYAFSDLDTIKNFADDKQHNILSLDIINQHLLCTATNIVSVDNLRLAIGSKVLSLDKIAEAAKEKFGDFKEQVCSLKSSSCKESSFNCWLAGCSKKDLNERQQNFCSSIGEFKDGVFVVQNNELISILKKDPMKEKESNASSSEFMKFFLDPKPTISNYVAKAEANQKDNKEIIEHNSDNRTGNKISNSNQAQSSSNVVSNAPTQNILPQNFSTPVDNTKVVPNKIVKDNAIVSKEKTVIEESKEEIRPDDQEDLLGAKKEFSDRIKNAPKAIKPPKNAQYKDPKVFNNDYSNVNSNININNDKQNPNDDTKKKDLTKSAGALDGSVPTSKTSSGNGLLNGSAKEISAKITSELKNKGVVDPKSSTIKATLQFDNLDIKNVDAIKDALLNSYSDSLSKGMKIELTLKQEYPAKEVLITFSSEFENGHYVYTASSVDQSKEALSLVSKFNLSSSLRVPKTATSEKRTPATRVSDMPELKP